ncbi:homoserine O-acetyltransferase/O-succinyltransferase family protein [Aliidiomarina sp. Khilg15.8]
MALSINAVPPASSTLTSEGVVIQACDSRPSASLRVGLLNLMPDKATTERHWLRLLAASGVDMHASLLRLHNWTPRSTSSDYMQQFYQSWREAAADLDAVIITGAPLGQFSYNEIGYWDEFGQLLHDFERRQTPLLLSCWAAHAALHQFHQLNTTRRPQKLSGVFTHEVTQDSLTTGLPAQIVLPHSRFAQLDSAAIAAHPALQVLMQSNHAGPALMRDNDAPRCYLLGHPEYEANTLALEYERDQQKGMAVAMPEHYFVNDNPALLPEPVWQTTGIQLLTNWLKPLQAPAQHRR